MTGYLLDTCAVSEFAKREPDPRFLAWASEVDPFSTYLSAVTVGELRYGIELSPEDRRERLESWMAQEIVPEFGARILAFDREVAERWGALRARARRSGRILSALDAAIAATAAHYDLTLVTRNESDFAAARVTIFNPWLRQA